MGGNPEEGSDRSGPGLGRGSLRGAQGIVPKAGSPLLARHALGALVTLSGTVFLSLALGLAGWGVFATAIFLFVAMEGILANNGIAAFIIQNPKSQPVQEATGNTLQCLVGLSMFCVSLGLAAAFVIAGKAGARPLVILFPLVGCGAFLTSFSTVPMALMAKKLRFRSVARIELSGVVVLYGLAVVLAAAGAGVELLGIAFVAKGGVSAVLAFLFARPRKLFALKRSSLREIYRTGGPIALSNVGAWFTEAGMPLIAGALLGTAALGIYRIAYTVLNYPRVLAYIFGRVLFSALSAEDRPDVRRKLAWRTFLGLSVMLSPAILTIGALASIWAPGIFRKPEWSALPSVFLVAGFHWTLYTLVYIPIQTLIVARRTQSVIAYFAVYSAVFLVGTVLLSPVLDILSMPVAGTFAAVASVPLLLHRFRQTYRGGSFWVLVQQLLVLVPLCGVVWYLGGAGKAAVAVLIWFAAVGLHLALHRRARYYAWSFLQGFASRPEDRGAPAGLDAGNKDRN